MPGGIIDKLIEQKLAEIAAASEAEILVILLHSRSFRKDRAAESIWKGGKPDEQL